MLGCVESFWYRGGLTEPTLCHQWWGAPSWSVGSVQVTWLEPSTYQFSKRLHWHSSNTDNVNDQSTAEGSFRSHFNCVLVSPLFKSPLSITITKNYGPGFSFSFLLKALEKVVASHLNSHINSWSKSNHYRSAYREFQSTEITLLKIPNDSLSSVDDCKFTALTLLDLSPAFDTSDHSILLRRLYYWLVVSEKALD